MSLRTRVVTSSRQVALFSAFVPSSGGERIIEVDGDVRLYRGWLATARATDLLAQIRASVTWVQERRKMYDRVVDVPREQAWMGDPRDDGDPPQPWLPLLRDVRDELERFAGEHFDYVLLNRYRDGRDSVAWHNDREMDATIGSLTLGATRDFDVRPKADRTSVTTLQLDHGDLVIMRGATQHHYEHRVRKDPRVRDERINLTFRQHPSAGLKRYGR